MLFAYNECFHFQDLVSQNTSETRTVLEGLQSSTEYMVGVSAVNSIGEGITSVHSVKTGTFQIVTVESC